MGANALEPAHAKEDANAAPLRRSKNLMLNDPILLHG